MLDDKPFLQTTIYQSLYFLNGFWPGQRKHINFNSMLNYAYHCVLGWVV